MHALLGLLIGWSMTRHACILRFLTGTVSLQGSKFRCKFVKIYPISVILVVAERKIRYFVIHVLIHVLYNYLNSFSIVYVAYSS
jgi:hypothetical protein